jgi:hypothetical protein
MKNRTTLLSAALLVFFTLMVNLDDQKNATVRRIQTITKQLLAE